MKMKLFSLSWLMTIALLAGGCTNQPKLYHWGSYEDLIYKMYHKPKEATPTVQIEQLSQDLQKAQESGKSIHPGLYAQLGFMYALEGNLDKAIDAFNQEKALFPEAAVLVDGMIARVKTFTGASVPENAANKQQGNIQSNTKGASQ